MRERVRTVLLVAAVLCLVAFLTYQVNVEKAAAGGEVRRHTLGLTFSPWFVRTVEDGPGQRAESTRITLASWSWLVLAAGALILGVREALGEQPPAPSVVGGAP